MIGDKIDLLEYLKSLPEVPDPFKPFENDPPITVSEKSEAEELLEQIRQRSLASLLYEEKKIRLLHVNFKELL